MKLFGLANQLGQVARAFGQGLQSKGKGFDKALEQSSHGEVEPGAAEALRADDALEAETRAEESAEQGAARAGRAQEAGDETVEESHKKASAHGLPSTASLDGKGLKIDMIA